MHKWIGISLFLLLFFKTFLASLSLKGEDGQHLQPFELHCTPMTKSFVAPQYKSSVLKRLIFLRPHTVCSLSSPCLCLLSQECPMFCTWRITQFISYLFLEMLPLLCKHSLNATLILYTIIESSSILFLSSVFKSIAFHIRELFLPSVSDFTFLFYRIAS